MVKIDKHTNERPAKVGFFMPRDKQMKKLFLILILTFLPVYNALALPSTPIVTAIGISINDPAGAVTGYWLYCSQISGSYVDTNKSDAGLVDIAYSSVFSPLIVTGVNYCVATSYDGTGAESQFSNEVVINVGTGGATQDPLPVPMINLQ